MSCLEFEQAKRLYLIEPFGCQGFEVMGDTKNSAAASATGRKPVMTDKAQQMIFRLAAKKAGAGKEGQAKPGHPTPRTESIMEKLAEGRKTRVFNKLPAARVTETRVSFTNKDGHAEIYLYDEIGGWGITAKQFADQLKQLGDVTKITLHINSPGGDVFDGAAIFNLLSKHKAEVIVEVDGMALSAASVVMCAGDSIKMAANAMVMIHDPWTIAMGSADDMRKAAELLDKVKQTIVDVYVARTANKADQVTKWMAAETWFSADEAVANKFASEITPNKSVAASLKPDDVRNAWKSAKDDPRKLRDLLADLPVNSGRKPTGPQDRDEDDDPDRPNPKPPKEPNAHGDADSEEGDTENHSDAWRVKLARRRQQLAALRA